MTAAPDAEVEPRAAWWALVLTGVIGGVLSGAFGVGGGILMIPLLIGIAHMDQRRAAATSLLAIIPAVLASSVTYLVAGEVDLFSALFLSLGGVGGSLIGTRLLARLPLNVLRWGFIGLLLLVAVRMALVVPERSAAHVEPSVPAAIALLAVGLVIGVASGLFGVGGGVVAVPALIGLFGVGDLVAKGTSLLFVVPTAITGTVSNSRRGLVDVRAGLIVGLAATLASFGGAALAFFMSPAVSSYLFAGLVLASAVQLSVRAWRLRRVQP